MGSAVFEMLKKSKYESGVFGARRRHLFTLKMQLFCTLASPSTPVYGMRSCSIQLFPSLPDPYGSTIAFPFLVFTLDAVRQSRRFPSILTSRPVAPRRM